MTIDISITGSGRRRVRKQYEVSANAVARCLETIAVAARAGARCPLNEGYPSLGPLSRKGLRQLVKAGTIRIEIFMHNWRRITILTGPDAGKATKSPPLQGGREPKPYRVLG